MNRETERRIPRRSALRQLAVMAAGLIGGAVTARAQQPAKAASGPAWDTKMEVIASFEISQPDGGRYRRPYVAVWLEDKDGKEVRTLSLWAESGRGERWLADLRRWYRDAHDYWVATKKDLILSMTSATRMPGKYSLTWDGKDDAGKLVPQGTYTLNIECAREHGPYGLVQKEIVIGPKPFKVDATGNGDIKSASVEYRKRVSS